MPPAITRKRFAHWAFLFLFVVPSPVVAQTIFTGGKTGSNTITDPVPVDPLGRQTPRGTVLGFIKAAQTGDYRIAAEYLQLTGVRGKIQGEELASQLQVLIDRTFQGYISQISDHPEGAVNDDEDANHEVAGVFRLNEIGRAHV